MISASKVPGSSSKTRIIISGCKGRYMYRDEYPGRTFLPVSMTMFPSACSGIRFIASTKLSVLPLANRQLKLFSKITFELIRLRSSRISSGSNLKLFHALPTFLPTLLGFESNSLYLSNNFSSSPRTFQQLAVVSLKTVSSGMSGSSRDRTSSTCWSAMWTLRTLSA